MDFDIESSTHLLDFACYPTAFRYHPHTWYELVLYLRNRVVIQYEMDTALATLRWAGLSGTDLSESVAALRRILTPAAYGKCDQEGLAEIFRFLPNGSYHAELVELESAVLVSPAWLAGPLERDGDIATESVEFTAAVGASSTPELLIPTQDWTRCDADTVELYRMTVEDSPKQEWPLPVLLREPQYFEFGSYQNERYFSGCNFFVLDGHHKLRAYEQLGKTPIALAITCKRKASSLFPGIGGSERPPLLWTSRLRMIALHPEDIQLLVDGSPQLRTSGFTVNLPNRSELTKDVRRILLEQSKQLRDRPFELPFRTRIVVEEQTNDVIGFVFFEGRPGQDSTVRVFTWILAARRKHGFGFEATDAALNWAVSNPEVRRVVATTEDSTAARKLAKKCGMHCSQPARNELHWTFEDYA